MFCKGIDLIGVRCEGLSDLLFIFNRILGRLYDVASKVGNLCAEILLIAYRIIFQKFNFSPCLIKKFLNVARPKHAIITRLMIFILTKMGSRSNNV